MIKLGKLDQLEKLMAPCVHKSMHIGKYIIVWLPVPIKNAVGAMNDLNIQNLRTNIHF